jgi:hypothetical protein
MDEARHVREPVWVFALIALALMFAIALLGGAWAASGFAAPGAPALRALAFPAAVGAGLAVGAAAGRIRRRTFLTRREAIVRGGVGFAAVGAAWPASFLLSAFREGGDVAPTVLGMLAPIAQGGAIGAVAGALAALAASYACLKPARSLPSTAKRPE